MITINLLPDPEPSWFFKFIKMVFLTLLTITAVCLLGAWVIFRGRIKPQHTPSQDVILTYQIVAEDVLADCEEFESPIIQDRRITVCLGRRNTGGYRVTVSKVVDTGPSITVHATELHPGRCPVIQTETSPAVTIELNDPPGKEVKVNMIVRQDGECSEAAAS